MKLTVQGCGDKELSIEQEDWSRLSASDIDAAKRFLHMRQPFPIIALTAFTPTAPRLSLSHHFQSHAPRFVETTFSGLQAFHPPITSLLYLVWWICLEVFEDRGDILSALPIGWGEPGIMSFLTVDQAIGVICGFVGFFIIIFTISCLLRYRRKPREHRKARNLWVKERQAVVRQRRAEAAELQRNIDAEMRTNRERYRQESLASQNQHTTDLESGLRIPPPARVETLPSYERALRTRPVPPFIQPQHRVGSESSVPSYNSVDSQQRRQNHNQNQDQANRPAE